MTDNSKKRLHKVFFYGLYMDPEILRMKNVEPRNPQIGYAKNFELRIGNKATLLRALDKQAYGIVYDLTHGEIDALYKDSGLTEYAAEAVMVTIGEKEIPTLCCNLVVPPETRESNADYEEKLLKAMDRLGVPSTQ